MSVESRIDVKPAAGQTTYYDLPVIHRSHWKWMIIFYFFFGGISGASFAIANLARLVGGEDGRSISRAGYYLSFVTLIPSPILLILDLKKPMRFLNMLRVIKLRSPMSIGVWVLVTYSAFSTLAAIAQAAEDGLLPTSRKTDSLLKKIPLNAVGLGGAFPAMMLSGYTGVLLAATAVPLWTRTHKAMGPLFLASAVSNASAALTLILAARGQTSEAGIKRLESLDTLSLLAESGLLTYVERRSGTVIARPLQTGHRGKLLKFGFKLLGVATPVLIQTASNLTGKTPPRAVTMATSALVLAGGFIFRYVIVTGGNESADDPYATFAMTERNPTR